MKNYKLSPFLSLSITCMAHFYLENGKISPPQPKIDAELSPDYISFSFGWKWQMPFQARKGQTRFLAYVLKLELTVRSLHMLFE